MSVPRINHSEFKFCEILWENEPISSPELIKLCREKLEWNKSTTYTIIRRLAERGVINFENKTVTSVVSREEAQEAESTSVIDRSFAGSLPGFVATFVGSRKLSEKEIDEIQKILDECRKKI
ncbi:MAG: BlaI/MecI/CopY family transcriptional regulator [Lachnospiraceae bacterium]|nr:BlaI/MecI/CopY family transcriptional regulator [Lachnospiraceae bacterium]MBR1816959.1 BlaI/MecI/CopY family transcriptional regulator [Lachnospiraceae bacterium]